MKELHEKLARIQGLGAAKDAKGRFEYATLNNIIGILLPILEHHDLLLFHVSNKGAMETHLVDVKTGQEIISSFVLPQLSDMQKMGGAVTYAKRYNIGQIFNMVVDKDDDGQVAADAVKIDYTDEHFDELIASGKIDKTYTADKVLKVLDDRYRIDEKYKKKFEEYINNLK